MQNKCVPITHPYNNNHKMLKNLICINCLNQWLVKLFKQYVKNELSEQ